MSTQVPIRAAGGVVWRAGSEGAAEVVLVHRPKYDDWSLPKGKAEQGETDADTALREVAEETGLRCRLGTEVASTSYVDSQGRPKVVRYWMMEIEADDGFIPNREVDELRWCSVDEASSLLTYEHDRALLRQAAEAGAP